MDASISPYVHAVAQRLRSALGSDLVGVYLIGSGAMGGFDPHASDVDVVAVASRRLEPEEKTLLVNLLAHPTLPCPVRKLELVVHAVDAICGPSPSLRWELNLETGPEVGVVVSEDPLSVPAHWFVLDAAMARDHAEPLQGPPPADVFGEIERERILRALIDSVRWHRDHDEEGVQSVLNACRAWHYLADGTWVPKPAAARWARARSADGSVIDEAIAAREAGQSGPLDREAVDRFVGQVRLRLQEAVADFSRNPISRRH